MEEMIIRAGYKQITHCRTILRRIRRCKHSGEADMCNLRERREKTHHVSERDDEDEYENECHAHDATHKHNNVVNLATRLTKKTMRGIMVNFAMNWRCLIFYVKMLQLHTAADCVCEKAAHLLGRLSEPSAANCDKPFFLSWLVKISFRAT